MANKLPMPQEADRALLEAAIASLQENAEYREAEASRAVRAAAALRGDAGPIGGRAAGARLAHLVLIMLRHPDMPLRPERVAGFLAEASGYLDEAPLDLLRTVEGAERVRRLIEMEPPLGRPDPIRVAAAADLEDLSAEEALAAYTAGHIDSLRLMAATGIRSFGRLLSALQDRGFHLPVKPTPTGDGRDDRDLLWELIAGREDPSLADGEARGDRRPTPEPSPELDAIWPTETPGDVASQAALEAVAAELDTDAKGRHRRAARAMAAAAGLRGDAAAVGGEEARMRLVDWTLRTMRRAEGEHRGFFAAPVPLQPLRVSLLQPEEQDGPLELAQTTEGAAQVERWFSSERVCPIRTGSGEPFPEGAVVEEAFTAYADGRISSQRLLEVTGLETFQDLLSGLLIRGLALPTAPARSDPGQDDRDLLWSLYAQPLQD